MYPTSSHLLIVSYIQNLTLECLEHSIKHLHKHYKISLSGIFTSITDLVFLTSVQGSSVKGCSFCFFFTDGLENIFSALSVDDYSKR